MTYSEIPLLSPGEYVNFKEYTLDRHQRKQTTLEISDLEVECVIVANTSLSIESLEAFYGVGLEEQDYLVLSKAPYHRLVLKVVDDYDPMKLYFKVIELNPYFMSQGLQELDKSQYSPYVMNINPNQLIDSNVGAVRGFKDYQVGIGLFNKK